MTIFSYYTTKLGFDPDATAIFNRMPNELLANEKNFINDWVLASKSSGNFSKYDYFYGFFLSDRDNALTDWITGKTATAVNSPSHTANQGFGFNGSTQYIDSNINLSTDSNNYKVNLGTFFILPYKVNTPDSASQALFGIIDTISTKDYSTALVNASLDRTFYSINDEVSNIQQFSPFNITRNNLYIQKGKSSLTSFYENDTLLNSFSNSDRVLPAGNVYVGARNRDGSINLPFDGEISFIGNGGDFNVTALNTELQILENNLIS